MAASAPRDELYRLIRGFQVSQAIMVAASLGLADCLEGGARDCGDLAQATGTHAPSLSRLLRALTMIGILRCDKAGVYSLTDMGQYLRSGDAGSHAAMAVLFGSGSVWAAWGSLLHAVKAGTPAFDHVHGENVWDYRTRYPEQGRIFDRAMGGGAARFATAVMQAYDFSRFRHAVDVGGGDGSFLAQLLTVHPGLRGTLFDQPHVVSEAILSESIRRLTERCCVEGGDFFTGVPAGGDVYLLKWILHDWDDAAAARILRECRRAMTARSRLLVVEHLARDGDGNADAALMDLNMMVLTGGRVRSQAELAELFREAGLRLTNVLATATPLFVLEGSCGGH
jgi:O-methyltransferase domain/Dimerisation domain